MTPDDTPEYPARTASSPLVRFLFPEPADRRAGAIIKWWEKRRLPYNLIVGGSGLLTMGLASLGSLVPPAHPQVFFALAPIAVVGLLANICYTLGPAIEIAAHKLWGGRMLPVGPTLFRNGLMFSVGLTLVLPTIMMVLSWLVRVFLEVF